MDLNRLSNKDRHLRHQQNHKYGALGDEFGRKGRIQHSFFSFLFEFIILKAWHINS